LELNPTPEERELQDGARRFLGKEITRERLLAWDRTAEGYDPSFWRAVSELGWIGFSLPESLGGGGAPLLDLALLLEECGRAIAPSAIHSAIVGARAIALLGGDRARALVPSLAKGERQVTLALYEPDGGRAVTKGHTRIRDGRLSGEKSFVRQAVSADFLVVAARDGEAPVLVLVPADARGVTRVGLRTFGGDRQSAVRFQDVEIDQGSVVARGDVVERRLARIRAEAGALALAEMVGGFGAILDMTVAYMKERVQFGQALAKFQGVQFKCADLATSYAATKHTAFQAIWKLAEGRDAGRELAIARAWCGRAYREATLEAHQLHGGAGYVVEHPLHRYSERAQSYAILFADEDDALSEVAARLLGSADAARDAY